MLPGIIRSQFVVKIGQSSLRKARVCYFALLKYAHGIFAVSRPQRVTGWRLSLRSLMPQRVAC